MMSNMRQDISVDLTVSSTFWLRIKSMNVFKLIAALAIALTGCSAIAGEHRFMGCTWNYPDRFEKFHETTWEAKSGEYGFISFLEEAFDENPFKKRLNSSQAKTILVDKIVDNGFELLIYNEFTNGKEITHLPSRVIIKRTTGDGYIYLTGLELDEMQKFVSVCMPIIE